MKYIHISIFTIVFFLGSTAWSQSDKKPNAFKSNAITFYYGTGSDMSQQQISDQLDEQLKYDYPNKANNTIQAPQIIGYQYHIKERLSIGLVYCISNVQTPTLEYPDFQNPGEVTEYTYRVGLNSFLGS